MEDGRGRFKAQGSRLKGTGCRLKIRIRIRG
jgi:hypothetical protein